MESESKSRSTRAASKAEPPVEDKDKTPQGPQVDINGGEEKVVEEPSRDEPMEVVEEEPQSPAKGKKRKAADSVSTPKSAGEESASEESQEIQPESDAAKDDSANESDLGLPPKQTLGKGKRARIPNKRYSDILLQSPRPQKTPTTPTTPSIENGEKSKVDAEVDLLFTKAEVKKEEPVLSNQTVTSIKSRSTSSSPAGGKRGEKKTIDLSNPIYMKPFHFGWKRELVYRGVNDNPNKRNGDIYYYMPSGKKLRSMREVSENLKSRELSLENFTFFKEPLGLDDPEKEIIRDARPFGRKSLGPSNAAEEKVLKSEVKTPRKVQSPKVMSPKPAKLVSPKVATSKAASEVAASPKAKATPQKGNFKVKLTPLKSKAAEKKSKQQSQPPDEATVKPEPAPPPPPKKSTPAKKPATPKSANSNSGNMTAMETGGGVGKTCSIRCEGVSGLVPTLQCRICLCLYHYECMGLSPHIQIQAYVCKSCQMDQGEGGPSPSIVLPPLTPINTLKAMVPPPPPPTINTSSAHHSTMLMNTLSSTPPLPRLYPLQGNSRGPTPPPPQPPPPPPPDAVVNNNNNNNNSTNGNKSLLGLTTWLPHSSTIQVNDAPAGIYINRSGNAAATGSGNFATFFDKDNRDGGGGGAGGGGAMMRPPRPQYVEYMGGRKFMIIPKHNVVSVSPTVNSGGPPVFLQSKVGGGDGPSEVKGNDVQQEPQQQQDLEATPESRPKRRAARNNANSASTAPDATSLHHNRPDKEPRIVESYLQNLSYGYSTLLYVFQYLKVQDLLRAGCVCTMWRDIASHPSLWKTVRMKNSQVHSFEGLANTLKKHGTVNLDLRKMLLPTTGSEDIWPEFSKAIKKVQTLRRIELCRCPSFVVEQLAETNRDLEVINAITIKCESMCLDGLANLHALKELRLKSTNGLTLVSDISALGKLTHLSHLSLTSIKDLNKIDLSVIASLVSLETLDLGECTDLPSSFGEEILVKLDNLEKLRLEKGQGNCHTFEILEAVKDMPKLEQLELVNFDIKSGFDLALGCCNNIKKLLVIPTYISQSATTNHMVLGGVLRLQSTLSHFVWGVTLELLRVTELFVDQCEDATEKKEKKDKKNGGNGDSIPVLKPVPLISDKNDSIPPAHDPPQVEILPLPNLQKLLLHSLPTTRVKILKIPFHATWRQSITDTVN